MNKRSLLIVAAAALILLVLVGQLPSRGRWAVVISDAAHAPVSALLAVIVFKLLRTPKTRPIALHKHWLLCLALTTAIGALIEVVQAFIGRDAQFSDVITDLLGATAGSGLYMAFGTGAAASDHQTRSTRAAGLAAAALAIVLAAAPIAVMATAYATRYLRFPTLMDGDAVLGSYFIRPVRAEVQQQPLPGSAKGMPATAVRVRAQRPAAQEPWYEPDISEYDWAVCLLEAVPDWRQWHTLAIDVFNPGTQNLKMELRVIDHQGLIIGRRGYISNVEANAHTRTQWRLPVQFMAQAQGVHRVDLRHVRGLVISGSAGESMPEFFILNIRLE